MGDSGSLEERCGAPLRTHRLSEFCDTQVRYAQLSAGRSGSRTTLCGWTRHHPGCAQRRRRPRTAPQGIPPMQLDKASKLHFFKYTPNHKTRCEIGRGVHGSHFFRPVASWDPENRRPAGRFGCLELVSFPAQVLMSSASISRSLSSHSVLRKTEKGGGNKNA